MTKREAKRLACRIGARYVERWLTSDWSPNDDGVIPEEDGRKLGEAVQQIVDELDRRSENLTWPSWWTAPKL